VGRSEKYKRAPALTGRQKASWILADITIRPKHAEQSGAGADTLNLTCQAY
jgi:hypothetical protein